MFSNTNIVSLDRFSRYSVMKEKSRIKSSKHKQIRGNKQDYQGASYACPSEENKFKNVLKERHYEDISEQGSVKMRKEYSKKITFSKKNKNNTFVSPTPKISRKASPVVSSSESDEGDQTRRKKHPNRSELNESYEELSRRKRRIQSELRALDLEEAAAMQAESKKIRRKKPDRIDKKEEAVVRIDKKEEAMVLKQEPLQYKKEESMVRVKQEPLSDDERSAKSKEKQNKASAEEERNKRKRHPSKSSGDERNWGKSQSEAKKVEKVKEKPNLSTSGKLAEDTNTYNGVVIKYNEPSEARKPRRKWRLYPFKGDSDLPFIPIHRQSAYLFGRTRSIADIPIDHPSCSKQHAVLQFRLVSYKREDGSTGKRVRPYIIDLESSNGTFVNNKKINARCYVELMEKDVVKFGFSSREYVVLHEESKNEEEDDDVMESN